MSTQLGERERLPGTFRASALALLLGLLPVIAAWTTGLYGRPPAGVAGVALGAHWVCSWAVPVGLAMIMAFGTAGMGVDPRVVAGGPADPRIAWWRTQLPNIVVAIVIVACQVVGQATWSGEPVTALLVPAGVGAVVALVVVNVVVARFGIGPSVAAGIASLATAVVTVLPSLAVPWLAIDGTLHHWMRGDQQRMPAVTVGALVWLGLSAAVVLASRLLPADVSGLRWISKGELGRD